MFKRFFRRLDFVFAAAAVVGVAVPLAWHARIEREHRRMLERVGAAADAKERARRALTSDLSLAQAREMKRMHDRGAYGLVDSAEYRRDVLAVYRKHGVQPPAKDTTPPDPDSPWSRRQREERIRVRLREDRWAVEDLYRQAERRAAKEARRRGEDSAAAMRREYARFAAERRRALLDVYARYGAALPPDLEDLIGAGRRAGGGGRREERRPPPPTNTNANELPPSAYRAAAPRA